jgi:hypothetical protein
MSEQSQESSDDSHISDDDPSSQIMEKTQALHQEIKANPYDF